MVIARLSATLLWVWLALPLSVSAAITDGVNWLATQQDSNGSYTNASALVDPVQSTAETLLTFQVLSQNTLPGIPAARTFLSARANDDVRYLARAIEVNVRAGSDVNALLSTLIQHQNVDGGFGDQPGGPSSILNTAYAVQALAAANIPGSPATMAVNYLLARQQSSGGWADGDNGASVYLTALSMRALWAYRFQYVGAADSLARAQAFLLSSQDASGLWGEHFNSALALIALVPAVSDLSVVSNSIAALQAAQSPNGGWSDDAYTTALALRALNAAAQPRPDPAAGAVAGRALDNTSGNPLPGVTITATGTVVQAATTGADGRYLINNVSPGSITLSAAVTGYLTASAIATVQTGRAVDFSPRLIKDPQPIAVTLRGSIVRGDTNAPLAGATVRVVNTGFVALTQADGRFELAGIPAGSVRVEISLSGFSTAGFAVAAASGGVVDFGVVALTPGAPSGTSGTVQGTVVDALTNEPLRNVAISTSGSDNRTALTDRDGRFTITGVNPGSIALAASLDGFLTANASGSVVGGSTLNFNARLVKAGNPARTTVTGRVVDATTGAPLNAATIAAASLQASSAVDGNFQLGDIPAGNFTLAISLSGYVGVSYSASAPSGGFLALGTIALARDVPVSGNRNPVITSRGPTSVPAGLVYAYNVQATDADGDALTFALGTNPTGMTISAAGQVRWIPTIDQVGTRTFSVVVFDAQGGRAEEIVNVNVAAGGSRAYVVTDVPTLNALSIDGFVPANYTLATYIRGGRPGNVNSSPPCPIGAAIGLVNVDVGAAFNTLERLAGQNTRSAIPDTGLDVIADMGQARSSLVVFPHIDHAPFPEEGIEYTVWGSDDPNATFPEGWRLATLVAIYRKGFAQSPNCGNQTEVDDFSGLYTFGVNSFRYVRIRTDNSISIFTDREHTTWSTSDDNGGEPGWQSIEGEVDAVGGMICDIRPTANAGADIIGLTGQTIRFDASATPGNILAYSWDLNGDGTIDLSGLNPTHVFASEFDRDVTLMVVDDRGCVGTDTVRVTIGLNFPRPDLTINQVDTSAAVTDVQTLRITGTVRVAAQNIGRAAATTPALVTVFEDTNRNGMFDDGTDNVLGSLSTPSGLARGASLSINVPVNGAVSFRDSPLLAMVDSDGKIAEEREDNNIARNVGACFAAPVIGTFEPVLKWAWTGSVVLPEYNQVVMAPVVAQTNDDNGDGLIDGRDIPDVIFISYRPTFLFEDGLLRILNGKDGTERVTVTNPAYRMSGPSNLAVADIDGDGLVEIVGVKSQGGLVAFNHDGTVLWELTSPLIPSAIRNWGGPAIADLDGDGAPEIIFGTVVVNNNGAIRWIGSGAFRGENFPNSTIEGVYTLAADIEPASPGLEIVAGASAYDKEGKLLWINTAVGDGFTAIGNFNADPAPEIVVVSLGRVFLLNNKGQIIWGPVTLPGGGNGGPPTVADMDGDGVPEIGVAGASRYVVFKADGSILWTSVTQDQTSNVTGSSVFDFDGDGSAEVIYADETTLRVYDGATGLVRFKIPNDSGTWVEYPVIVDIDNDDHADMVVVSNTFLPGAQINGIRVFQGQNNSWVNTRKIWNQHSYHITNINDDGTVPRVEKNSWLAQNTYRLNAFPERTAPAIPDLTIAMLRATEGAGGLIQLSARAGNAGAGAAPTTTVAFYEGDPNIGGRLLGNASVAALQPGEFRDVAFALRSGLSGQAEIFAVVDPDNAVSECREDNNRISGPAKTQSSAGDIAAMTDAPAYDPQAPVLISATATNTSSLPAAFDVSVRVEDGSGAVLMTFGTRSAGSLAGGASIVLTENWNTNGYLAGGYRVRAQLLSIDGGALLDEALATFSIRATTTGTTPNVTLRTTTDRPVYNTVDLVNIESLVANTTTNALLDNLRLRIRIKNSAGAVIFTHEGALGQLPPSALRDVLLPFGLNGSALGTYRVEGEVVDAGTGEILATSATQFSVIADPEKALTGAVNVANPTVEIGTAQICTYTINNRGTEPLNNVSLRMTVANITAGAAVDTATHTVNLVPSGTQNIIRSISTASFTAGDYACALEVLIGDTYSSLGFANFKVVEPPIRIHAALSVGEKGRLLLLVDAANQCEDEDDHDRYSSSSSSYKSDDNNCPKDTDPHGPKDAPSLSAQRSFLENLLKQAGWSYTITDTVDAFTRELRTGGYAAYALLSEQVKLSEDVQKELREATFRGEGLVIAGSHDNRNQGLNDALGIKRIGTVSQVSAVTIPNGPLGEGAITLLPGDRFNRIKRLTAGVLATYQLSGSSRSGDYDCRDEDDDRYKDRDNPRYKDDDDCHKEPDRFIDAVTFNTYGAGKALFAGFDLLAQATKDGQTSLAADVLRTALTLTHPTPVKAKISSVIPVVLSLTNQGVATGVTATVTIPIGTQVADAGTGSVQTTPQGQTISWVINLAINEERRLTFYLRLPNSESTVTLTASVHAGTRLITQASLSLAVEAITALDQLVSDAKALANTLPTHAEALNAAAADIDKANRANKLETAVGYVLKATDDLVGITDPQIQDLRRKLDEWLRNMSMLATDF